MPPSLPLPFLPPFSSSTSLPSPSLRPSFFMYMYLLLVSFRVTVNIFSSCTAPGDSLSFACSSKGGGICPKFKPHPLTRSVTYRSFELTSLDSSSLSKPAPPHNVHLTHRYGLNMILPVKLSKFQYNSVNFSITQYTLAYLRCIDAMCGVYIDLR